MENVRVISTLEELEDYFELVCKDINKALEDQVTVDSALIKPIVFKVPSSGEVPYIDTYWMRAFVNFSDQLMEIMATALQRKLTEEEEKNFQVRVYVKKGSNLYELVMQFADFFNKSGVMEIIPEMSVGQLLSIVVPVAVSVCVGYCFKRKEREKSVRNKQLLEAQTRDKKIEADAKRETAGMEIQAKMLDNQVKVLEIVKDILDKGDKAEQKLARDILKNPDLPDSFEINYEPVRKSDLKEIGKSERHRKEKPVTKHYKGEFLIDKKDYSKDGESVEVEMKSVDGLYVIKAPLPPDMFTDDELNDIEHKKPIMLSVTGDYRNDQFVSGTYSISVIRDGQTQEETDSEV